MLFSLKYISSPSSSIILLKPALGGYISLLKSTWLYLQSPCSLLHNDPALGGYTGWSFLSIRQLQVPGCCKHDNPALGGYIIWSIQFLLVTGMNNMDFFKSGSIYIEASLKPSLCSAQDLGATGIIILSKKYFSNSLFWANRVDPVSPIITTLCLQPGVINNHEPALATIMNRC